MERKYRFLPRAATMFRVFGWIVLVGGVIGSIVMGASMGTLVPGFEGMGVLYAIGGIVYAVIIWVSFLAFAEILHLLMDLEQNTRETADRLRTAGTR